MPPTAGLRENDLFEGSIGALIRPSVQVLVGGSRSIPGLQALLADVGHEDVWKDHGTVLLLVDLEQ
jgi:hypothetical protein